MSVQLSWVKRTNYPSVQFYMLVWDLLDDQTCQHRIYYAISLVSGCIVLLVNRPKEAGSGALGV